jgi:hypothetical protein
MTIRNIAIVSLILGLSVLTVYAVLLFCNGYLSIGGAFSLENASKIAPFVGSCVGVFFTLAGTLLVFENLQMTRLNNETNQLLTQKNQFENIFFNLLTQQRQIKDGIKTTVHFEEEGNIETSGSNFFDDLATRITMDFDTKVKTSEELIKLYNHWFMIHNSDLGHFFRHLFHIVKFVDRNPYFLLIEGNSAFLQKTDYVKILRAQLSNSEIVLLALNGLTKQGEEFKKYIDDYELLVNINLEIEMPSEYISRVPSPEIIVASYKQLEGYI